MKIVEMKNTKIKNGVDGFNWRLDTDEEKINCLEYRSVEDIKTNLWKHKIENVEKNIIGI